MNPLVNEVYGKQVRVRASGLCFVDNKLLMVNHTGLTKSDFWAPPGGGVEFEESVETTLKREFKEETGLDIVTYKLLFVCEFIRSPLHAIELFFEVARTGGVLLTGRDPEMDHQIIKEARFMTNEDLDAIPMEKKHGLFALSKSAAEITQLRGYFKI